jgi:hypothetical protein
MNDAYFPGFVLIESVICYRQHVHWWNQGKGALRYVPPSLSFSLLDIKVFLYIFFNVSLKVINGPYIYEDLVFHKYVEM